MSIFFVGNLGKNLMEGLNAAGEIDRGFPILKRNLKSPKIPGKYVVELEFGTGKGPATRNTSFSKYVVMHKELDGELESNSVSAENVIDLTDDTNNDVLQISLSSDSKGNYFPRRKILVI